jgi:hypothetical protein
MFSTLLPITDILGGGLATLSSGPIFRKCPFASALPAPLPISISATRSRLRMNGRFAPEAAIRALAKFYYWGSRRICRNTRRLSSSHETQSRYRRAFYARARVPPDRDGSNRRVYMKTGSVGGLVDRDSSIPGKHFAPDYKQHSPSIQNGNSSATTVSARGRWQTSK